MTINMMQLSRQQIIDAMDRGGYNDVDFLSHKYLSTSVNRNGHVCTCYQIRYWDDEGEVDTGFLYIERRGDELFGDF